MTDLTDAQVWAECMRRDLVQMDQPGFAGYASATDRLPIGRTPEEILDWSCTGDEFWALLVGLARLTSPCEGWPL